MPATEPVLTITLPSPCLLNCFTACLQPWKTPRKLMLVRRSKSSEVWSSNDIPGLAPVTPALLNITSRRPNRLTTVSTAAATSSSTVTSHRRPTATPPAVFTRRTVSAAQSSRTSAQMIFAPSEANRSADARPTPEPAPVITTERSMSSTGVLRGCDGPGVDEGQGACRARLDGKADRRPSVSAIENDDLHLVVVVERAGRVEEHDPDPMQRSRSTRMSG